MSRTVRYKLTEAEFRVVLEAASGLGVSVDELGKQALALVLQQARELAEHRAGQAGGSSGKQAADSEHTADSQDSGTNP